MGLTIDGRSILSGGVRRVVGFVVGAVMALAAAAALADEAEAQVNIQADSDGYVPIIYSCWAGNEVGLSLQHQLDRV